MKRLLFSSALTFMASACFAQQIHQNQNENPQKFTEQKSKLVLHIQERISDQQKELLCAQSATDSAALKACRPNRGTSPGHDGMPMRQMNDSAMR